MTTEKTPKQAISYVTDQQIKLPTSGTEVRKGVNVLYTSSPKNPAPNPFVQSEKMPMEVSASPASNSNQTKARKE